MQIEPCMCGATDCERCRPGATQDDTANDYDQRQDHKMSALVDDVFNEVLAGRITPQEASDQLNAAGVPFDVQCRVLIGATKEIAA